MLRTLCSTSIAILIAAAPGLAAASPPFPQAIVSDLGLTYSLGTPACQTSATPDCHCTICHSSDSGGVGTVVQPFGKAMKMANLVLENTQSLQMALSSLQSQMTDSDCDGIPDIQQLKDGRDPNPPGEYIDMSGKTAPPEMGCSNAEQPAFGCGAQLSPVPAPWQGAAAVLAILGASLVRRRSRWGTR